ncbi:hypothetical protein SAMN04488514_11329 [Kriegella aquimaris]|uniref:Uncharacterized protein n=1 Tax=Kriegella aquimaris TaxID=192904 RepID=A0A1G9VCK3_9FLAO|nr:hypothetical protein SAMN04488514_11329 [Kriegella aquimaris]
MTVCYGKFGRLYRVGDQSFGREKIGGLSVSNNYGEYDISY